MNEYDYIDEVIQDDFLEADRRCVTPLFRQSFLALTDLDLIGARDWEELARKQKFRLLDWRERRRRNLAWLQLDTQLRKEGKTYPDIMESPETNQSPGIIQGDQF